MRADEFVILMYHELAAAGRPACESTPGYLRYVLTEEEFRVQLRALAEIGLKGVSLSAALATSSPAGSVVLTFDDGTASDRATAAKLLADFGFGATFFIVPGFLGRPGYLSAAEVRELSDAGQEIGSHSMRHDLLTRLPPRLLLEDLVRSKEQLEAICGRPVENLSCPAGRWSPGVASAAREAGYTAVATSRIGINGSSTSRYRLARLPVRRGTSSRSVTRWSRGEGLAVARFRGALFGGVRALLGDGLYQRLHRGVGK
jgi:peptidoglycan/xylan/chitin deacetylase (PgdA/CDA1 family)